MRHTLKIIMTIYLFCSVVIQLGCEKKHAEAFVRDGTGNVSKVIWLNGGGAGIDLLHIKEKRQVSLPWSGGGFPFRIMKGDDETYKVLSNFILSNSPNELTSVQTTSGDELIITSVSRNEELVDIARDPDGNTYELYADKLLIRSGESQIELVHGFGDGSRISIGLEPKILVIHKWRSGAQGYVFTEDEIDRWEPRELVGYSSEDFIVPGVASIIYIKTVAGGMHAVAPDGVLHPSLIKSAGQRYQLVGVNRFHGQDYFLFHSELHSQSRIMSNNLDIQIPGAVFSFVVE